MFVFKLLSVFFFLLLNLFRLEISFTPFLICFFFFQFVIKFLIYSLFNLISLAVAWVDDGYHFCLSCIFQRTIIDDGFLCNYVCVWRRKKESFALCVILSCFHRYKFRSAHWIGSFILMLIFINMILSGFYFWIFNII